MLCDCKLNDYLLIINFRVDYFRGTLNTKNFYKFQKLENIKLGFALEKLII